MDWVEFNPPDDDPVVQRLRARADAQPEPEDPWAGFTPEQAGRAASAELTLPPGFTPDMLGDVAFATSVEKGEAEYPWDDIGFSDPQRHVLRVERFAAAWVQMVAGVRCGRARAVVRCVPHARKHRPARRRAVRKRAKRGDPEPPPHLADKRRCASLARGVYSCTAPYTRPKGEIDSARERSL
jgi:hypothetical protein